MKTPILLMVGLPCLAPTIMGKPLQEVHGHESDKNAKYASRLGTSAGNLVRGFLKSYNAPIAGEHLEFEWLSLKKRHAEEKTDLKPTKKQQNSDLPNTETLRKPKRLEQSEGDHGEEGSHSDDPACREGQIHDSHPKNHHKGNAQRQNGKECKSSPKKHDVKKNSVKKNPPWNLKGVKCDDRFRALKPADQWKAVDGDKMVKVFTDWYNTNKLTCDDCFGQTKGSCKSDHPACKEGLRDQSKAKAANDPRWDVAIGNFADGPDDLKCSVGEDGCTGQVICENYNGPGGYAFVKSLVTFHGNVQKVVDAINEAEGHVNTKLGETGSFTKEFVPLEALSKDLMIISLITGIGGGVLGLIPGVGGAIASTSVSVGAGVGMDLMSKKAAPSGNLADALGDVVKAIRESYETVSESMVADGTYQYQSLKGDKKATIKLADLMAGGKLMSTDFDNDNYKPSIVKKYQHIMFQQIALFAWMNRKNEGHKHLPFIAFDNGACKDVDQKSDKSLSGSGIIEDVGGLHSKLDYGGKCFYLLDALPKRMFHGEDPLKRRLRRDPEPVFVGPGGSSSQSIPFYECHGNHALPGAKFQTLEDHKEEWSGLSLGDFIIPSVEGWKAHKKRNDYPLPLEDGQLINDPRSAGAVNIPVCDYLGNKKAPGARCPKLGAKLGVKKPETCEVY